MGVPFGFSLADIVKAIKLSKEIYDRYYNEDQGASQSIHHLLKSIATSHRLVASLFFS